MLFAHEANKKTQEIIKKHTTEELSEVEKLISEAIADGKFAITNSGTLQRETIQKLEELGYKVENGSQYHEVYYSVSWKDSFDKEDPELE